MPLFMDRHNIQGATAEEVAQAHHSDLKIQHRHNCRALTYWYDESRGAAFCLIEAPSPAAVNNMHREAHGLIPNQIIEVDGSAVTQFLGRITDPEKNEAQPIKESAFRAIMFIDMASSTDITRTLGDDKALALVHMYRAIVRDMLMKHGGREVDRAGDGFLTSFESVYSAVKCAISIQRELLQESMRRTDGAMVQARIGVGAGEPIIDGDTLFGTTINLTARICDCGQPGQIIASRVVRELCVGKPVIFRPLGQRLLKGFDEAINLELIVWQE
jgi:class 3 adenylate cyclase